MRQSVARGPSTLSALYKRLTVTGHTAPEPHRSGAREPGRHPHRRPPTVWVQGTNLLPVLAAADERDETGHLVDPRAAVLIRLPTLQRKSGLLTERMRWAAVADSACQSRSTSSSSR